MKKRLLINALLCGACLIKTAQSLEINELNCAKIDLTMPLLETLPGTTQAFLQDQEGVYVFLHNEYKREFEFSVVPKLLMTADYWDNRFMQEVTPEKRREHYSAKGMQAKYKYYEIMIERAQNERLRNAPLVLVPKMRQILADYKNLGI